MTKTRNFEDLRYQFNVNRPMTKKQREFSREVTKNLIGTLILSLCVLCLIWWILSFIDVNIYAGNGGPSPWNFFNIFDPERTSVIDLLKYIAQFGFTR